MHDSEDEADLIKDYTKKTVKLILNNSSSKIPIKRSDIVAHAIGGNSNMFNDVFEAAKKILTKVYGISVYQVPNTKNYKIYITVSTLESASTLEYTEKQKSDLNLLFLVLSYIFMKGEPVKEESVFNYLKKLKIPLDKPNENFPFLVQKHITESYVKNLYLKRDKIHSVTSNENEFFLSWGFRANLEFPKKNILNTVARILQKPTICFVRQHSEVLQMVEEDMEVDE